MALASPPRLERLTWSPVEIAVDRCKGCELCIAVCSPGVLALDPGVINRLGHRPIRAGDLSRCTSCALCARVCPDAVFTVYAAPKATTRLGAA